MTVKTYPNSSKTSDGSFYGSLTDGIGNLAITATTSLGTTKTYKNTSIASDGSKYMTLTDGNGNLV